MPKIIQHIDAIARAKKRDVLFVKFHTDLPQQIGWEQLPVRRQIIAWLEENGISWSECGAVGSTTMMVGYRGQIYIDVPFDPDDAVYRKLCSYLEKPDGTMAWQGAMFCYYPLQEAMKNAHHDEPGFWEQFASDF